MMRSLLFVPGDSPRKFEKALLTNADLLILDLEDSVAEEQKIAARSEVAMKLRADRAGKLVYVRVNDFGTGLTAGDLAAVMPGRPDGIMLPKSTGGDDIRCLSHMLDALEAAMGITPGGTGIIPVATESAGAVLGLQSHISAGPRLRGLLWGGEDLAADLGATENREDEGYTAPFLLARNLCLMAATAAGVPAIDAVYTNIRDLSGLAAETRLARRDGFAAKALIHPAHIDIVNAIFAPTEKELAWARQVLAALTKHAGTGVVCIDGMMIDKPHERAARRIIAAAGG